MTVCVVVVCLHLSGVVCLCNFISQCAVQWFCVLGSDVSAKICRVFSFFEVFPFTL